MCFTFFGEEKSCLYILFAAELYSLAVNMSDPSLLAFWEYYVSSYTTPPSYTGYANISFNASKA